MVIVGKRNLLSNNYDSVILFERKGGICCKAKSNNKKRGILISFLEKELGNKKDIDKSLVIVNNFLKYNKIIELKQHEYIPGYTFLCTVVSSVEGKQLAISEKLFTEENKAVVEEMFNSILLKYSIDRYNMVNKYLENENIKRIYISGAKNESSYSKLKNNRLVSDGILLHYAKDSNNSLNNFDEKYIKSLIEGLIKNSENINTEFCQLNIDDYKVVISNEKLLKELVEIANNYNKDRENVNKLQLRMKGF